MNIGVLWQQSGLTLCFQFVSMDDCALGSPITDLHVFINTSGKRNLSILQQFHQTYFNWVVAPFYIASTHLDILFLSYSVFIWIFDRLSQSLYNQNIVDFEPNCSLDSFIDSNLLKILKKCIKLLWNNG